MRNIFAPCIHDDLLGSFIIDASNPSRFNSICIANRVLGKKKNWVQKVRYDEVEVSRASEMAGEMGASADHGEAAVVDGESVADAIEKVWRYHHMQHELPERADGVLCLCSSDIGVARVAADVYLRGGYSWLLFSGGIGTGIHSGANMLGWEVPEAEVFRDAAIEHGVPSEAIYTEGASTNSGANVTLSAALLRREGLPHTSIVVVQKPFMERRAYATFKKVWPEPEILIHSTRASWDEYVQGCDHLLGKEMIINIMVRIFRFRLSPTLVLHNAS
jgi:hypothetical protein